MEKTNIKEFTIDAKDLRYRELNSMIKELISAGESGDNKNHGILITLENVIGQRYIGDAIKGDVKIKIKGVPGNDMAAFMDGPEIEVFGNSQDGVANTMNSGRIIIHGSSGDIMGYSMRGGEIYVRDNVGWRSGIHMKSYLEKFPVIVIGGRAGNFLGEYMAGGIIIVLGLEQDIEKTQAESSGDNYYFERFYPSLDKSIVGEYAGTGMHGGAIFLRGDLDEHKTGKEVKKTQLNENDIEQIKPYIKNFCSYFNKDYNEIISKDFKDFIKLAPYSHRPYGKLYAY